MQLAEENIEIICEKFSSTITNKTKNVAWDKGGLFSYPYMPRAFFRRATSGFQKMAENFAGYLHDLQANILNQRGTLITTYSPIHTGFIYSRLLSMQKVN